MVARGRTAAPLPDIPTDAFRPTHYQGVKITEDTRASNLPGRFFNYRRIFLDNGTRVFGCWDCPEVIDENYNVIYDHRTEYHADDIKMPPTPRRAKRIADERSREPEPVDQPTRGRRKTGGDPTRMLLSVPVQAQTWTLGQIIEMADGSARLGNRLELAYAERDALAVTLAERERELLDARNQLSKVTKALGKLGFIKDEN